MGCYESKGHKIFDYKKKSLTNGNVPTTLTEKQTKEKVYKQILELKKIPVNLEFEI
jgi:hypothetical protein